MKKWMIFLVVAMGCGNLLPTEEPGADCGDWFLLTSLVVREFIQAQSWFSMRDKAARIKQQTPRNKNT
jgi:hypothetical protein